MAGSPPPVEKPADGCDCMNHQLHAYYFDGAFTHMLVCPGGHRFMVGNHYQEKRIHERCATTDCIQAYGSKFRMTGPEARGLDRADLWPVEK